MKKILYSVFSAVALLSIAACSNNDDELDGGLNMGGTPNPNVPTTIIATTESSATTRTALQGDDDNGYKVVWSEGDQITLAGSDNPTVYASVDYALQEGAGTTEGKFAPVASAVDWAQCSKVEAFYGVNNMQWPAEQTYRGEDVISNAPMYCSVNNQHNVPALNFKNMGGILRLTLKGYCAVKSIIVTTPSKAISGAISEITSLGTARIDANGGQTITLQMDENVQLTPEGKTFNIAMPSGDYSNVKITIADEDDNQVVKTMKTDKNLAIRRSQITNVSFSVEIPTYVDLGLSVKWATFNIGAGKAENVGHFFAWGETSPRTKNFDREHYKFYQNGEYTKYTSGGTPTYDNKLVLDLEDDAAHVIWGGDWRMPTVKEINELVSNCQGIQTTTDDGVNGYIVRSKINGNEIFLPQYATYLYGIPIGSVWSSTHDRGSSYDTDPEGYAYILNYGGENQYLWGSEAGRRYEGRPIRPVCP